MLNSFRKLCKVWLVPELAQAHFFHKTILLEIMRFMITKRLHLVQTNGKKSRLTLAVFKRWKLRSWRKSRKSLAKIRTPLSPHPNRCSPSRAINPGEIPGSRGRSGHRIPPNSLRAPGYLRLREPLNFHQGPCLNSPAYLSSSKWMNAFFCLFPAGIAHGVSLFLFGRSADSWESLDCWHSRLF